MSSCLKHLLYFVFGLVPVIESAKFRCDYKYCKESKVWYKYHVIPATWNDARLMCTFEGGILASPTTPAIRNTMIKFTGKFATFTGLHAIFSKGNYHTIDGVPLEEIEHAWDSYEPDNALNTENCLALNSRGLFLDVKCDQPRPYMCYRSSSADVNACGTPDPEYLLESGTNKCYKFHTTARNFERASFACTSEGGHLAIINDEVEAAVLRELFIIKYPAVNMVKNFRKDVAYIGFHNWGETGDWRTMHGQTLEEAGYDNFSPGKPSNSASGDYCGSIYRTALLNDVLCNKTLPFICEKKPDYPPVCNDMDL